MTSKASTARKTRETAVALKFLIRTSSFVAVAVLYALRCSQFIQLSWEENSESCKHPTNATAREPERNSIPVSNQGQCEMICTPACPAKQAWGSACFR